MLPFIVSFPSIFKFFYYGFSMLFAEPVTDITEGIIALKSRPEFTVFFVVGGAK